MSASSVFFLRTDHVRKRGANPKKVAMILEELELPYKAEMIDIADGELFRSPHKKFG